MIKTTKFEISLAQISGKVRTGCCLLAWAIPVLFQVPALRAEDKPLPLGFAVVRQAFLPIFKCAIDNDQDFEPQDSGSIRIGYTCATGFLFVEIKPQKGEPCTWIVLQFVNLKDKDPQQLNDAMNMMAQLTLKKSSAALITQMLKEYTEAYATTPNEAKAERVVDGIKLSLRTVRFKGENVGMQFDLWAP